MRHLRTAVVAVLLVASAPAAWAHRDDTADPSTRCDKSAARGGHDGAAKPGDLVIPLPNGWEVWAPGGHYVLRGADGYVEVVGGQGYNRNGNQGGYVQGEYDPAGPGPDVDFHANAFAGSGGVSSFACVMVGDQRVATPGDQPDQPKP